MLLALKIEEGHSTDVVIIDNVMSYVCLGNNKFMVTYEDPSQDYELFDIIIKHVAEIKEVRL